MLTCHLTTKLNRSSASLPVEPTTYYSQMLDLIAGNFKWVCSKLRPKSYLSGSSSSGNISGDILMILGCLPFPTRDWRCGRACYGVGEEPWYVLSHYYSVAALVQYCTWRGYLCMCYNSKGIPTVDHYFVPEILWRESQCPTIVKGIHSAWII